MTHNKIDDYIGRSQHWPAELTAARKILLGCGLEEAIKWGKPTFSHEGDNIVILQEMKDFLALMFFKGALLPDPAGVLKSQGPNSRSALRVEITSVADLTRLKKTIKELVAAAIAVEQAGLKVAPAPELVLVEELQQRIDSDAAFKAAFEALTPGRQREYHLHISDAKQAATRLARIDKVAPKVLAGKGFRDA